MCRTLDAKLREAKLSKRNRGSVHLTKFMNKISSLYILLSVFSIKQHHRHPGRYEAGAAPALNLGKKSPNFDSIPAKMGRASW